MLVLVQRQFSVLDAQDDIKSKVREELGDRQREYVLREQMKAIQKELGETDTGSDDLKELRDKLDALQLPPVAKKEVDREWQRLQRSGKEGMEASVIRTFLENVAELPWNQRSQESIDLELAARVLEEDHYGLAEVKDRVLEFLAVRKLRTSPAEQAPIQKNVDEVTAWITKAQEDDDGVAIKEFAEKDKWTIVPKSAAVQAEIVKVMEPIWKKWARRSRTRSGQDARRRSARPSAGRRTETRALRRGSPSAGSARAAHSNRVLDWLVKACAVLACADSRLMTVVISVEVVLRSFFNATIEFTDEYSGYMVLADLRARRRLLPREERAADGRFPHRAAVARRCAPRSIFVYGLVSLGFCLLLDLLRHPLLARNRSSAS